MRKVLLCLAMVGGMAIPSLPHAATTLSYDYDANGSMTSGDGKYFEYNDANQLVRVRHGDATGPVIAEYVYDYNGQRIKKVENGVTTYYVGKHFEQEVAGEGQAATSYYFANGERVAKRGAEGQVSYYHLDHLGGANVTVDASGNSIEKVNYFPFGDNREIVDERYTYSSKEKDNFSDSFYFEARHYDYNKKHFTQPDTVEPNYNDPQDLNKYAYARNNPIIYLDPTGHSFISFLFLRATHPEMLVPRYPGGNFGGPSWTGGVWDFRDKVSLNDPIWRVRPSDNQDELYKSHDIGYRTGNKWGADINLVRNLKTVDTKNMSTSQKIYKTAAGAVFTAKVINGYIDETRSGLPEASTKVSSFAANKTIHGYESAKELVKQGIKEAVNSAKSTFDRISNFFNR